MLRILLSPLHSAICFNDISGIYLLSCRKLFYFDVFIIEETQEKRYQYYLDLQDFKKSYNHLGLEKNMLFSNENDRSKEEADYKKMLVIVAKDIEKKNENM